MNYVRSVADKLVSKENLLKNRIKRLITNDCTNFEVIGEELYFKKNHIYNKGQCDLWLASNNFLLSLELKTGQINDFEKKNKLLKQTIKYKSIMEHYYPDYYVYGLGIYLSNCGKFQYYELGTNNDISLLKESIESNCNIN